MSLFLICNCGKKKKTDMKFTILTDCTVFLSVEFSSVKNTHIVEQPISTFSFC